MKRYNYFSLVAAAMALVACSNENIIDTEVETGVLTGEAITFNGAKVTNLDVLSDENADGTEVKESRSTIDNGTFSWSENDLVSVSDGTLQFSYKVVNPNGSKCSFEVVDENHNQFTGDGAKGKTFYCAYPAAAVKSWNGSTVTEQIYAEQDYTENVGGKMGAYMVTSAAADAETGTKVSFQFNYTASVLDVNLSSLGVTPKAVYLKSNSGVAIAGEVKCDVSDRSMTVSTTGGTAYCTSSQSDVIALTNVASDATIARFYILPVKLVGGVTVTVVDSNGNYYTKSTSSNIGNDADFTVSNDINSVLSDYQVKTTTIAAKPYYKKVNFGAASTATRKGNWMATIPSNIYFNMLSTPGAHDACTKGNAFGTSSECQDLTLQELLDAGVRCFDIRPGYYLDETITADNLYIWHGITKTDTKYVDAIKMLADFLAANPTESISIIMTKEKNYSSSILGTYPSSSYKDRSNNDADGYWPVIKACHEEYKAYFKQMDHSNYNLGDYRGKIFYVNRTGTSIPYTVNITKWPDDNTVSDWSCVVNLCNANVQDKYNSNGTTKQNAVKDMLQLTSASTDVKKVITYNFNSSANSPSSYANANNPALTTNLNGITGPTSYLMCDYIGCTMNGGDVLLKAIVNQNYKYVFKGRTRNTGAATEGIGVGVAGDEYADDGTVYARPM